MIRIGVDFGGTKIEAAALDEAGRFLARVRAPNPGDYAAALEAVRALVEKAEAQAGGGRCGRVGVAMPGSISPRTGTVRNANSVWLNGRRFGEDLEGVLGRPVRLANDANCLALSEATDGAAAGARVVFAAILGTGVGGGIVVDGRLVEGRNGVAGEWGHTPLPWLNPDDEPGEPVRCWCGRDDCLETYFSGPGLARDYREQTGETLSPAEIVAAARGGRFEAAIALEQYGRRLGRGLAAVCDILDPDVIVLGGGMSNVEEIYPVATEAAGGWVFSDSFETPILKAVHGDSSGVRGAAWLWPLEDAG